MRFFITKKVLVGVIIALCAVIYVIFLSGCVRGSLPPAPKTGLHDGPAAALASLAVWAAWIAGIGLLGCGVMAFLRPSFAVAKFACSCLTILCVSFLLGWVAANATIILGSVVVILLLGAVGYTWLHRVDVKKKTGIDLNWLGRVKAPK